LTTRSQDDRGKRSVKMDTTLKGRQTDNPMNATINERETP
jgi:hypothetical protein